MIRAVALASAATTLALGGAASLGGYAVHAASAGSPWVRPLSGAYVSQGFGCTDVVIEPVDLACPKHHWHSGVDLAAPRGTPVHAAFGGVVAVHLSATGYGLHVSVDGGDGITALYAHLASVDVVTGDVVGAGDVLGTVGSTGNSTGPHLHFEVRRDGIPEDPRDDVALP